MTYSLKQAAKATGKSKPTIQRAIKSGKMSATITESGTYQIDPAELHRVFHLVTDGGTPTPENDHLKQSVPYPVPHETELVRRDFEHAAEKIAALKEELDRQRTEAQADLERERETINDLRRRLDSEGEERRRATAQLTALLTDRREKAPARRKWFNW